VFDLFNGAVVVELRIYTIEMQAWVFFPVTGSSECMPRMTTKHLQIFYYTFANLFLSALGVHA
jgi:hypothetical protein